VPGNDLVDAEVKLLELLKRLGIFFEIGKSEIPEVFLQNQASIHHLFLGKVNEDIIRVV
jgi:hypothetical protein